MRLARERVTAVAALAAAAAALALAVAPQIANAQAGWRLEQPPPPDGAQFKVPLGPPGDLKFWSRNRGVLAIEGNSTVARGLYAWNGENWHQLSTVCGGQGDTTRVAIAGPTEFWTISEPSRPRFGNGTALCHFKDGRVIGSFSTADQSRDPYRMMDAAACNGPNDCWFGGFGAESPTGDRRGAFHLHWDGSRLSTVYAPQGRGVTDIEFRQGVFYETTLRGARPENADQANLAETETFPALIHQIAGGVFSNDQFTPSTDRDGTELLGLDAVGDELWAVGGGAASGPVARSDGGANRADRSVFARGPIALRRQSNGTFAEVPLGGGGFSDQDRLVDVAVVPGDTAAWVAVQRFDQRAATNVKARVARLTPTGVTDVVSLPTAGSGRGGAAKIEFTDPNDGWLVTSAGWLFHWTDGSGAGRDNDPAFASTISFRPNEAAEQFVPDTAPADDSLLLQPPPVEVTTPPTPPPAEQLPALLKGVTSKLHGHTLWVKFTLVRKAKVQLIARRKTCKRVKKKNRCSQPVVAQTANKLMRKGKHTLKLKLSTKRWPTRLQFKTKEPGVDQSGGDDANTITTPGPGGTDTTGTGQ